MFVDPASNLATVYKLQNFEAVNNSIYLGYTPYIKLETYQTKIIKIYTIVFLTFSYGVEAWINKAKEKRIIGSFEILCNWQQTFSSSMNSV